MKTIKYLLFILFCCYTTLSYSQVESVLNDNILSPDSIAKAVKSMCDKLEQAKQKVKENPKDERAWLEYSGVLS